MSEKGKKDKLITAILAWFLGAFGGHRFYLGQTGMGVAYLLGSITMVGLIITGPIALIDFIGFLMMDQATFDRKYNGGTALNMPPSTGKLEVADEIHKLNILFEKGVITFEEFERRKQRLLH